MERSCRRQKQMAKCVFTCLVLMAKTKNEKENCKHIFSLKNDKIKLL